MTTDISLLDIGVQRKVVHIYTVETAGGAKRVAQINQLVLPIHHNVTQNITNRYRSKNKFVVQQTEVIHFTRPYKTNSKYRSDKSAYTHWVVVARVKYAVLGG